MDVQVFDPAMCCSTGVCGPTVDPALATFASDLAWLAAQGVSVQRHNLSQEPKAFAERDLVRGLLAERGDEALPAVVIAGELRSWGRYPTRTELAAWSLSGGSAAPAVGEVSCCVGEDATGAVGVEACGCGEAATGSSEAVSCRG